MKGQDGTGCKFTVACSKLVQISGMTASPRTVCDARRLKLRRGDILIAGTDGLFDNIGDSLSLNHAALAVAFASSTQSSADMRPCGRIWSSSPWHSRTTRVRALVNESLQGCSDSHEHQGARQVLPARHKTWPTRRGLSSRAEADEGHCRPRSSERRCNLRLLARAADVVTAPELAFERIGRCGS